MNKELLVQAIKNTQEKLSNLNESDLLEGDFKDSNFPSIRVSYVMMRSAELMRLEGCDRHGAFVKANKEYKDWEERK